MKCIIFILALCLSGCAGGMIPISDQSISTVAAGATTTVGYVTDASAIKEMAVHKTLQNRDKMVRDAHKDSGMQVGWMAMEETIYYPGMAAPITVTRYLPTIKYNEQAEFNQQLPTSPSEHPAWRTVERLGVAAIHGTVIGYGINAASDVLQSAVDSAGHNTTVSGSGNNSSDNSFTDNAVGPVDNSDNSDNSIGPVDNSDNSNRPVDNSQTILPASEPNQ